MVEVWNFIDIELVLIVAEQGPQAGKVARTAVGIVAGLASAGWTAKAAELIRREPAMAVIGQLGMAVVGLGQLGTGFEVVAG